MPDLSPAPSSLGLASPALGPWFETSSADVTDLVPLAAPDADLGCPIRIPDQGIWNAPASGLLSYHIATASRPEALAVLRQANGSKAFADNALILLFTLLPEVSARLGALSHAAPRPDSTSAAAAGVATRPVITRFALELAPGVVDTVAKLVNLLPDTDSSDLHDIADGLSTDAEKAGYVGLAEAGGLLSNGTSPASILRRPEKDDRRMLENQSTAELAAKLWAFDINGRPVDPGTVAAIWAHLAGPSVWTNLWASSEADRQRTTSVQAGKYVHLVNAHEGPLEPAIKARIAGQLTDLNAIAPSDVLFTAGANPAIALSAAGADDTAPLPRAAPLPAGPYAAPGTAPFAGWGAATALDRDFLRVALTDIERHCVGLGRAADTPQADARLCVSPARNSAATLFLPTSDAVATEVITRLQAANATVQLIAPELDKFWGPQTAAPLGGGDPFAENFDEIAVNAHAYKGSGSTDGGTAEDQSIVLHFEDCLPDGAWVRVWPHGRDTTTGRRFRMDGGAGLADGEGTALVVAPLPNGTNGDGSDAVQVSFDMMVTTDTGRRLYTDLRVNRPAVVSSGKVDITALGSTQSLYLPMAAGPVTAGSNSIPPGAPVIVVTGAVEDRDFASLDKETIRASDISDSLTGLADGSDSVITRSPAFVKTKPGDLPDTQQVGGPARVHDGNFHKASSGQEIYDFAAYDSTGNLGLVGGISARDDWHEAPPASGGHAGVSAAPEIHGAGVAVAGPAADALRLLMRERVPADIEAFVRDMGTPFTPATAPAGAGPWTALLETAAKGTHGHMLMSLIPGGFNPGDTWTNIRTQINTVLSNLPGSPTVQGWINTANFNDATAAAAFDRVLHKNRNGAQGFARAALAAIKRAEDLVWLQTPAICNESFAVTGGDDIHLLQALTNRLAENPALHVMLVLPEKHLPGRNDKLNAVRKGAVGGALKALKEAAGKRMAWVAPNAAPGRPFHISATTLIVDDALLLTGGAHAWRRGLVFDSALTASVFDERLIAGRPQEVVTARRTLAAALLGIEADYVPGSAPDLIAQARAVNTGGGFQRANPAAYKEKADPTPEAERAIWNPALSAGTDWTATLAALTGDIKTEYETGTR